MAAENDVCPLARFALHDNALRECVFKCHIPTLSYRGRMRKLCASPATLSAKVVDMLSYRTAALHILVGAASKIQAPTLASHGKSNTLSMKGSHGDTVSKIQRTRDPDLVCNYV